MGWSLKEFIQKRKLATYYVIAILIEIILIPVFLLTGADEIISKALEITGMQFNTDMVTAFKLMVLAPMAIFPVVLSIIQVAAPDIAVFVTLKSSGSMEEWKSLKKRFRFWGENVSIKKGLKIWSIMIFTFSLMNLGTAMLNAFFFDSKEFIWNVQPLSINFLVAFLIAMFLDAGALFEENGWRGFMLPGLQKKHNPLIASIILGTLWSVWHMPVKFGIALDFGFGNFLIMFSVLTIKFILISIIITFFFNLAGESTILAIAMHGLSNDSIRIGGIVESPYFLSQLLSEVTLIIPMLLLVWVLMVVKREKFFNKI